MSKNIYRNTRYSKNKGFTLVELVVVIVVLGILAATAIPKFINLRADAKSENLKSISGTMQSALQLVHSRALIEGQNLGDGAIDINGIEVPLYNGYPSVRGRDSFVAINAQVKAWLNIDSTDRNTARKNRDAAPFFTDKSTRNNQIYIFFTEDYDQKSVNFNCLIRYENPVTVTPSKPVITIQTDAC